MEKKTRVVIVDKIVKTEVEKDEEYFVSIDNKEGSTQKQCEEYELNLAFTEKFKDCKLKRLNNLIDYDKLLFLLRLSYDGYCSDVSELQVFIYNPKSNNEIIDVCNYLTKVCNFNKDLFPAMAFGFDQPVFIFDWKEDEETDYPQHKVFVMEQNDVVTKLVEFSGTINSCLL